MNVLSTMCLVLLGMLIIAFLVFRYSKSWVAGLKWNKPALSWYDHWKLETCKHKDHITHNKYIYCKKCDLILIDVSMILNHYVNSKYTKSTIKHGYRTMNEYDKLVVLKNNTKFADKIAQYKKAKLRESKLKRVKKKKFV